MIVDQIKKDEGFVATEYICPAGYPSIGYGTRLPLSAVELEVIGGLGVNGAITKEQAEKLLRMRLRNMTKRLEKEKPVYNHLSPARKMVLQNMAYQMGVGGLLGFKNMWSALEMENYCEAALHMLDSLWYREQTPERALRLAMKMSNP